MVLVVEGTAQNIRFKEAKGRHCTYFWGPGVGHNFPLSEQEPTLRLIGSRH